MRSEEGEKISTQGLGGKSPRIGKLMLIGAVAILVAILFVLLGDPIRPLLLFCAAAIFYIFYLYLIRKEQAVAARVCGILGGLPLAYLSLHLFAIPAFVMAIGGVALALRKPKLAGVLMLIGAIGSWAALLYVGEVAVVRDAMELLAVVFMLYPSISFLTSGGILALTSQKGQLASKKMVVVAIAAFFLAPALLHFLASLVTDHLNLLYFFEETWGRLLI